MNISLAPEVLFYIGFIPITNSILMGFLIVIFIAIFGIYARIKLSYDNPGKFQLLLEMMFGSLYTMAENSMERVYALKYFAFLMTFFIFIIFSNWLGITPLSTSLGVNTEETEIEQHATFKQLGTEIKQKYSVKAETNLETAVEEYDTEQDFSFFDCLTSWHCYLTTDGVQEWHNSTHLLRAPTSDLSMAIAFALISVVMTNIIGLMYRKKTYLKKYINFSGPIPLFVGLLEIVSEIGKIISFSFRLFGNVFAGEVLLIVITVLTFGLATLPFLLLEIFVGAIQAFVFFILTAVFIGLAVKYEEH